MVGDAGPSWDGEFVARRPHPVLRGLVGRYIGYRQRGVPLTVHRGLPSRYVTLIVSLADPVRLLGMPGSAQPPDRWTGLVGGLHAGPTLIGQDRDQAGVHLQLHPLGVHTLLGLPSAELAGWVLDLAELPRPALAELPDRLRAAPDWAGRFAVLDEVLLQAATRERPPPDEVRRAWQLLVGSGGSIPVAELAADVGWSRRHLSERFAREVGLSPKQAGRVLRFERATALLRALPPGGLAEVAARCGYFDQAHLSNEYRALAGCSPRTWLTEELPFLQDAAAPDEPDSRA
jgi:AraC-like DNA-binding protein